MAWVTQWVVNKGARPSTNFISVMPFPFFQNICQGELVGILLLEKKKPQN